MTQEFKRVAGYRAQLVAAIHRCDNGATVELDITSARAIAEILKALTLSGGKPPP